MVSDASGNGDSQFIWYHDSRVDVREGSMADDVASANVDDLEDVGMPNGYGCGGSGRALGTGACGVLRGLLVHGE